jgi:probable H4MPT-linked C1 transfer pathway protein
VTRAILGWSIGTHSVSVVRLPGDGTEPDRVVRRAGTVPPGPAEFARLVTDLGREAGAGPDALHALTLAGDLATVGPSRRVAVAAVLDVFEATFPRVALHLLTTDGRLIPAETARREPFAVSGTRWLATAELVASLRDDAVLVDVGSAVTDVVPVAGGAIASVGRTDPERLLEGELLGTGVVATPVEAVAARVPLWDGEVRVTGGAAVMGDVHLWRGALAAEDYTPPERDGIVATREHAGDRLARVVCGDREMLDELTVGRIAATFATAQVADLAALLERARRRHPAATVAVVTGVGAFVAAEAARTAGLAVERLAERIGAAAARAAPALSVAHLLAEQLLA